MKIYTGTSGFSYREWAGSFYPQDIKADQMLSYYSNQLGVVEINNTFYRFPKKEILLRWRDETPDNFLFSIKASRKITHIKMLADAGEEARFLIENLKIMNGKLGAILFQLPPWFKKNIGRLSSFLEILPGGTPAVFEFRDNSWYDGETAGLLKEKNLIFCFSDTDEGGRPDIISTSDWGYLRLRRNSYSEKGRSFASWAEIIKSQGWKRAFIFFKHEGDGTGANMAKEFNLLINN